MRSKTFFTFLIYAATLPGVGAQRQDRSAGTIETTVSDYGVKTFLYTRTSGSLVLLGACRTSPDGDVVVTDQIKISEPRSSKSPDEALDILAQVNDHITWHRQSDGLVQVKDDRASAPILSLLIKQVELKDVVDLGDAIHKLLLAPEIKTFLDRNRIEMPVVYSSSFLSNQLVTRQRAETPSAPRYSRTLTNVTLEQALNSVVRDFPGVWTYSECPGRITITADLTGAPQWEKMHSQSNK
jgi:hypothetical protein